MVDLPDPETLFRQFEWDSGGTAGARTRFQRLITDLVALQHPTASTVGGPGGSDWGIDTYVGSLAEDTFIWQSKFFPKWEGESQRNQVRGSFNEIMKKSREKKVKVSAWTLCVPCILPPEEQLWFDTWAQGKRREKKLAIELWNGDRVRRFLMYPNASHLRNDYFGIASDESSDLEPLAVLDDPRVYDEALFVRQLEEAGRMSNDAERGRFFAAEALARNIAARKNQKAIEALYDLNLEVQGVWDGAFGRALPSVSEAGQLPGLIEEVLDATGSLKDPDGLRLRASHRKGMAHRLVEDGKAGWVAHWRQVHKAHTLPVVRRDAQPELVTSDPAQA